MNKPRMVYFENNDIIHIVLSEDEESMSYEISPNITAELNDKKEIIGLELLHASEFIRDSILESVQAKILSIS